MNAGDTHYVASNGTPALKKAIVVKLKNDNGLEYQPSEIIVTPGGKQALFAALMATVEEGVDIMLLEPAWVSYQSMVELAGGRAVHVGLDPDDFRVTREALHQRARRNLGDHRQLARQPDGPGARF